MLISFSRFSADFLLMTLQSFYDTHEEYGNSPLYICSQADGSQLALALAVELSKVSCIYS